MPPRPLSDSGSIKMFLFANSGWGKTRLLGSSPGGGLIIRPPVDYVDSIMPVDKKNWQEWVVHDWSESDDIFEYLRHARARTHPWVWLDSISAWQDIGLDDLWETIILENPKRKRYGLDKGDYWINMQRLGRLVRDLATLSDSGAFNLGITAWPKELSPNPEDPEADEKQMPFVQGKNMAMKICGYTNIVAYGDMTKKGTRQLHFMETERHYAKCQFDNVAGPGSVQSMAYKMSNPTMPKIVEMIAKSGGISDEPRSRATRKSTGRRTVVRNRKAK